MASLRSTMVMVPQDAFLFDTTIIENVRFGRRDATDDEVRLAFIELGLDGWLDTLADGHARPGWASGASTCRPASASSWRWPGPTSPTRRASCSTRPPAPSTPPPRPAWPGRWRACPAAGRRSPSPTGCRRRPGPTGCSSSRTAGWSSRAHHDDLVRRGGVYAGLHASWVDATSVAAAASFACAGGASVVRRAHGAVVSALRRSASGSCSATAACDTGGTSGASRYCDVVKVVQAGADPLADQSIYGDPARLEARPRGAGEDVHRPRRRGARRRSAPTPTPCATA